MIGHRLVEMLSKRGYSVHLLSTGKGLSSPVPVSYWDYQKGIVDKQVILDATCIIHLAGAGIGDKRWSRKRKQEILDSRVSTSQLILKIIRENRNNLKTFISASATGYYGSVTSGKIFNENDPPANDFTGRVCQRWEEVADNFETIGIRTVKIRTGIVLAKNGGVLAAVNKLLHYGFILIPGNGDQYLPWIHLDDLCRVYLKAIVDETMRGAINAVAPEPDTMNQFMSVVAEFGKKKLLRLHICGSILKIIKGEMADILLKGSRVSPSVLKNTGFTFGYPSLSAALEDLLH